MTWFKSSYSGSDGDNCLEVAWAKSTHSSGDGDNCVEVGWSKSTHSGDGGDNCVEVAAQPHAVLVRDSKDPNIGRLTPTAWAAFTAHLSAS
ncbi:MULTISPECIES: DUF397 domain-containing protein [Streptomyces]|uniref:DUF397 domain-containing protein n=1 Tax=Streptomyces TaxID=1883 RepID=UPI00099F7829|nr:MULTISPECIES: DUF397 domain-containing protein [Streptomyces]TFI21040.1 DUF397 domain-containing protein [Streptomyces sp. 4R-3d]